MFESPARPDSLGEGANLDEHYYEQDLMTDTSRTLSSPAYKGRLGKTSKTSVLISSELGPVFPASIYTGINATHDAELRDALIQGELNTITSPFSSRTYTLAIPLRYHDEELRLFALVIPDALRHEEFKHRSELLQELAREREVLPEYVRQFVTVFNVEGLARLIETWGSDEDDARGEGEAIERRHDEVDTKRAQLDEVSARLERERERMDEIEERLSQEREEIERERGELDRLRHMIERDRQTVEADRLNLQRDRMEFEQGAALVAPADEKTQVVTDDQLLEVSEEELDAGPSRDAEPLLDASEILEEHDEEDERRGPAQIPRPPASATVPSSFDDAAAMGTQHYTALTNGSVVASVRSERKEINRVLKGEPEFFVQYVEFKDYPLVSLLVATLDEEERAEASFVWLLDPAHNDDRAILDSIGERETVRFAFYDMGGKLVDTLDMHSSMRENIAWIEARSAEKLRSDEATQSSFGAASKAYLEQPEDERLGTMRHPFEREEFKALRDPSRIALATGIVGYWSSGEVNTYLIGTRAFPLSTFRAIQHRVIEAALHSGIAMGDVLRQRAIEGGFAGDDATLTRRLVANFAELSVGLKPNDLDPVEHWENWEALLDLADESGVELDADVVELAQRALRRAQEHHDIEQNEGIDQIEEESEPPPLRPPPELVVAKTSETTGVTYFLPDEAVIDQFDDMESMSREDLTLLLDDTSGRLEASQILIERFGADVLEDVLVGCEEMMIGEVAALAKFLEERASGMQGELVHVLEKGGPSTTYVVARALAHTQATSGIVPLLEAAQDPDRGGDTRLLAQALAGYGDKLLPALKASLKKNETHHALRDVLIELEGVRKGTLDELSEDHHEKIRSAADAARRQM